jgi:hypothetical protein
MMSMPRLRHARVKKEEKSPTTKKQVFEIIVESLQKSFKT